MNARDKEQLGKTLWAIADQLRGAMNADDFRDYMLSFLFLRYLSSNYEESAKKELGKDYPDDTPKDVMSKLKVNTPLEIWYKENSADVEFFEKQISLLKQQLYEEQETQKNLKNRHYLPILWGVIMVI